MEIHLTEAEILRILLEYGNALTPEIYKFKSARIQRYPVLTVILSLKGEDDEAQ